MRFRLHSEIFFWIMLILSRQINKQLQKMEKIAIKNGYAVAIAHPRDATIQALSQWLAVMVERGLSSGADQYDSC